MLSLTTQIFITTSRYCDTNHIWVQKNNTWITANWKLRFSFPNFISALHHQHLHWWLFEKGNRNNWWTLVQWECLQVQPLYIFPSSGVWNLASLLPISTEARGFFMKRKLLQTYSYPGHLWWGQNGHHDEWLLCVQSGHVFWHYHNHCARTKSPVQVLHSVIIARVENNTWRYHRQRAKWRLKCQ